MTISRSEDVLLGILCLGLLSWAGWIVVRGLRDDRLPIGRSYIGQAERPNWFKVLFVYYVLVALLAAAIALELLLKIDVRIWL